MADIVKLVHTRTDYAKSANRSLWPNITLKKKEEGFKSAV